MITDTVSVDLNGHTYQARLAEHAGVLTVSVHRDNVWAGSGTWNGHRIEDCPAILEDGAWEALDAAIRASMTAPPPRTGRPGPDPAENPEVTDQDRFDAAVMFGLDGLAELDRLTREHTAFPSFMDMVIDPGGVRRYRPSLYGNGRRSLEDRERAQLADAYDRWQTDRGDARRAYRG